MPTAARAALIATAPLLADGGETGEMKGRERTGRRQGCIRRGHGAESVVIGARARGVARWCERDAGYADELDADALPNDTPARILGRDTAARTLLGGNAVSGGSARGSVPFAYYTWTAQDGHGGGCGIAGNVHLRRRRPARVQDPRGMNQDMYRDLSVPHPIPYALSKAAMRQSAPVPSVVEKSETTVGTKALEKDSKLYSLLHVLVRCCNCGNGRGLTTNPNPIRNLRLRTHAALVTSIKPEVFSIHLSPIAARTSFLKHQWQPAQILQIPDCCTEDQNRWHGQRSYEEKTLAQGARLKPQTPTSREHEGIDPVWGTLQRHESEHKNPRRPTNIPEPLIQLDEGARYKSRRNWRWIRSATDTPSFQKGSIEMQFARLGIARNSYNPKGLQSRWPVGIRVGAPSHHQKSAEYGQRGGEWATYRFGVGGRMRDGHLRGEDGG
ncbi:hypothetical protein B0H11DRAFT_2186404 [Mycena galericulata]|nr:hypothetical protein B0H11DRAFT_2186404 [Mycena galericulata]